MAARGAACIVALLALLPPLAHAQSKSELLDRLVRAYPDALATHDDTTITWRDGTVMPVDDGVSDKPFDQMLRNASILDQMRLPYPLGPAAPPARSPGRPAWRAIAHRLRARAPRPRSPSGRAGRRNIRRTGRRTRPPRRPAAA